MLPAGTVPNDNFTYLTYEIGMKTLLNPQMLGYGIQNLHLLLTGIFCVLLWAVYHWLLGLCVVAWLELDLVLLGLGIIILFYFALIPVQSYCTTQMICQFLVAQLFTSFCNLSNSSLNGYWRAYVTSPGGAWYGLLPPLISNLNMSAKQAIPEKRTSSNSFCNCS